jgi:hypothetical protein
VVFEKTSFAKFKIRNNFKQTIGETDSKHQESIGKSVPGIGLLK